MYCTSIMDVYGGYYIAHYGSMYGTVWYTGIVCRCISSKLYGAVVGRDFPVLSGVYIIEFTFLHTSKV